nr:FAD-dependent oxidoreductase [Acholeplasmatales bacterium]
MKVAIVGGGIAGLSCGIYLAKQNVDVTIYEKNHYVGGFLTTWERKDSIIDGCMHWMLGTKDGSRFNKIWKDMGVLDHLDIINPETFCSIKYDDNWFHYYRDIDRFEKELLKYSDNDDEEINLFIEAIKSMGVMEIPTLMPYDFENQPKFRLDKNVLRKLKNYLRLNVKEMAMRFNSKVIRYALRNCLINEHFNAYYFIQTLSNFMNGNDSLPKGCTKAIQDGMINRFLSYGGNIIYNEEIKEVIIDGNKAKGIKLKNNNIVDYDYICLATDPYQSMKLLNKELAPYNDLSLAK